MSVLLEDNGYQAFFKEMLKKHGVSSISQLKDADAKKAFFTEVKTEWAATKNAKTSETEEKVNEEVEEEVTGFESDILNETIADIQKAKKEKEEGGKEDKKEEEDAESDDDDEKDEEEDAESDDDDEKDEEEDEDDDDDTDDLDTTDESCGSKCKK
jgi:hypothetical protein